MASAPSAVETRTIRKVSWRLLPLIVVAYLVAYIDRTNVAFASLTMNKDIGLSSTAYGLGAGIFFIGYFLFDVPSNVILHEVGATIFFLCIATMGIYGSRPPFWPMPSTFLSGTAAAGAIALINSVGNLGGQFGPSIVGWVKQSNDSFSAGLSFLGGMIALGALLTFLDAPSEQREDRPHIGLGTPATTGAAQ
jgi:hypothetical protein